MEKKFRKKNFRKKNFGKISQKLKLSVKFFQRGLRVTDDCTKKEKGNYNKQTPAPYNGGIYYFYAMGTYLTQIDVLTQEDTPLGIFSQSFSPANRKRSAFERELIAATTSVRYFAPYLHDRNFTLYTDNKALYHSCLNNSNNTIYSPSTLDHVRFLKEKIEKIEHIEGVANDVA